MRDLDRLHIYNYSQILFDIVILYERIANFLQNNIILLDLI